VQSSELWIYVLMTLTYAAIHTLDQILKDRVARHFTAFLSVNNDLIAFYSLSINISLAATVTKADHQALGSGTHFVLRGGLAGAQVSTVVWHGRCET
jgi:hypothetical protein